MQILVTGGAGYVGSRLVPQLMQAGHDVVVCDTFWFGNHLPQSGKLADRIGRLEKVHIDIRHTEALAGVLRGTKPDVVIHLACLSNDPSSEIDKDLTKAINLDAFEPLVIAAKEAGVRRFINCSTSSVYGVSDSPDVREDHELVPITLYNTYKAACEPLLFKHQTDEFVCVTLRPSTVCGYSPRQRLDLAVNILTNLAVNTGTITVFGGAQKRPNLHIDDMVRCYLALIDAPDQAVAGQTFNVGAGNMTLDALAELVQSVAADEGFSSVDIKHEPTNDIRSYQVNSDKIASVLGFHPIRTVENAVHDLCAAFRLGLLPYSLTNPNYFNVKRMRELFPDMYVGTTSEFDPTKGHLSEIDMLRNQGKLKFDV